MLKYSPDMRRWKYLLAGFLVVPALGFLLYRGFSGAATYYYTLPEFYAKAQSLEDSRIRVSGKVGPQPVKWDARSRTTSFTLVEDSLSLPVVYKGSVPDAFQVGGEVVVEGKYRPGDPFEADQLVAKCPTRYVPKL